MFARFRTRRSAATRPAILACMAFLLTACSDDTTAPPVQEPPDQPIWVDEPVEILSGDYLHDRFFRLDLPEAEPDGRSQLEQIDVTSIRILEMLAPGVPDAGDVLNVAAYIDSLGFRQWPLNDFSEPYIAGQRWRQISDYRLRLGGRGELLCVDLEREMPEDAVLAVSYRVVDGTGDSVQVGDDVALGPPTQAVLGGDGLFYRLKLLKPPRNDQEPYTWGYPLRNVYGLGGANLDPTSFDLSIEMVDPEVALPALTETGIPWIRIFGLDQRDAMGEPHPDGIVDFEDPTVIDLERGLVYFRPDLPEPFAAPPAVYEALAAPDIYPYDGSWLSTRVTPEIYAPDVPPGDHEQYSTFRLRWNYRHQVIRIPPYPGGVDLARNAWMRAAVPHPDGGLPNGWEPAGRTEQIRWFAPRDRVLARELWPVLARAAGDLTVPALELYLRDDDAWTAATWGGVTTGLSRTGADLTRFAALEVWVNDGQVDAARRSGRLHVDVGYLSEDGYWPLVSDEPVVGTYEREDANYDGVWTYEEDIGLDGGGDSGPERYDAAYEVDGDAPYPYLNGTARNNREDDEDVNGNGVFDRDEGYFTAVIDLFTTVPEIDVLRDNEDVGDLAAAGHAWRRYRLDLAGMTPVSRDVAPNLAAAAHLRLWFEDPTRPAGDRIVSLQIAGLRFVE